MQKYKPSILQDDMTHCYVCGSRFNIEIHHIYFGSANRKKSTEYGCVCALCYCHHRGDNGAHHNKELNNMLKQSCQIAFEEKVGTREFFIKEFGRSYL